MKIAALIPCYVLVPACCAEEASAPRPETAAPVSILTSATQVIEALGALRTPDEPCQLRAFRIERVDDARGGAQDRATLELTVHAAAPERAGQALEELRAALAQQSVVTAGPSLSDELERAFVALDWNPAAGAGQIAASSTLQLELQPARAPRAASTPAAPGTNALAQLETYVRTQASYSGAGQVNLSATARELGPDEVRLVLSLEPADRNKRFSLHEIAWFLLALEEESPDSWLTKLSLTRSPHEPDPNATRGWTFQAELCADTRSSSL